MKPSLTDTLCTRCGLCCDGSLFAEVELANADEALALEVMGLKIEDADAGDAELLLQPCGALKGRRCSIYARRPECCRTFECRLLQEVQRGEVGIAVAKAKIAQTLRRTQRVKELVLQLGLSNQHLPLKELCGEALTNTEEFAKDPVIQRVRVKLQAAMTSVERSMQENFLSRGRHRRSALDQSST